MSDSTSNPVAIPGKGGGSEEEPFPLSPVWKENHFAPLGGSLPDSTHTQFRPIVREASEEAEPLSVVGESSSPELENRLHRSTSSTLLKAPELDADYTPKFFQSLLVEDLDDRQEAMNNIFASLEASDALLRAHIRTVVRLSLECPFNDVRSAFSNFLEGHRVREALIDRKARQT